MKIVQQIALYQNEISNSGSTIGNTSGRFRFFKARYTGITAIYFQCVGYMGSGANTGRVQLYDVVNNAVIAELTISGTTMAEFTSADIESLLGDDTELVVRYARTAGGSSDWMYVHSISMTVLQDTTGAAKKTVAFYGLQKAEVTTTSTTYTGQVHRKRQVFISGNDGTITCTFEAYLWSTGTYRSYARLYDYTAAAAVAGSEIYVTGATPTYVSSGAITLVDGHYYGVQYKAGTNGQIARSNETHIGVMSEAFTKCSCLPATFDYGAGSEVAAWRTQDFKKYLGSLIDADTITAKWQFNASIDSWSPGDHESFKLTREDTGATITGSEVNVDYVADTIWLYLTADITLPAEDVQLNEQNEMHYGLGQSSGFILVFLTETPVVLVYIAPDSTMPSGYHCFMSNYLKNVTAGNIPLKTPDGLNKLWA